MPFKNLIFVPGLTGSNLTGPPSGPLTFTIWLSPTLLATGGLRLLRLPVPGEDDGPLLGRAVFPGPPLGFYYGHLFAAIRRRGWNIILPNSDWRKPIMEDARRLKGTIENKYPKDQPIYIVCHSRGGLVVRQALAMFDKVELEERGVRVVGIGVPHEGSANAVAALGGYDGLTAQLLDLGRQLGGRAAEWLGLDAIEQVLRSWPSVYELLPKPGSSWMKDVDPSVFYDPATYRDSEVDPVPEHLESAKTFWRNLPPVPPWVEWINIAGDGVPTYDGVLDIKRITERGSMSVSNLGDGTVHIWSAVYGERKTVYTPTEHDALPLDGRLFDSITWAIGGQIYDGYTLKGNVLNLVGGFKRQTLGRRVG